MKMCCFYNTTGVALAALLLFHPMLASTTTDAPPYCLNEPCFGSAECCPNTYCLTLEHDPEAGGRCIGMHNQQEHQLCSTSKLTNQRSPSAGNECGDGLFCRQMYNNKHPHAAKGVGVCTRTDGVGATENERGVLGDACKTSIDCEMHTVCCRELLHGRQKYERRCDSYDNFVVDCEFDLGN